jgi:hypothetical protein
MALSLANAEIINIQAGIFVPIAFGTGALGMLVGGLWGFRPGNDVRHGQRVLPVHHRPQLRWFAPEIAALASGRQATAWRRNRETPGRPPERARGGAALRRSHLGESERGERGDVYLLVPVLAGRASALLLATSRGPCDLSRETSRRTKAGGSLAPDSAARARR